MSSKFGSQDQEKMNEYFRTNIALIIVFPIPRLKRATLVQLGGLSRMSTFLLLQCK